MFGLSRVFEDDPFFRDTFTAHNDHTRHLFSEPFGRDPFLSIEDRQGGIHHRRHPNSQMGLRDNDKAMSCSLMPFNSFGGMGSSFPFIPFGTFGGMAMSFPLMPFGCFGGMQNMNFRNPFFAMDRMMSNMRNGMVELQSNFDKMAFDPNAHSYSSSSVMTYSKKGDEPPKVFQASAQTRTAPGGIKEIRKACRDSESGLEKMAIGHHIHDRGHVVQKAKNNKTGDEELNQEFINLDEGEANAFDEQWHKEILKFKPSGGRHNIDSPKHRSIHHVSKEDAPRREKMHPRTAIDGPRRSASSIENLSVKGSHVPLKPSKK